MPMNIFDDKTIYKLIVAVALVMIAGTCAIMGHVYGLSGALMAAWNGMIICLFGALVSVSANDKVLGQSRKNISARAAWGMIDYKLFRFLVLVLFFFFFILALAGSSYIYGHFPGKPDRAQKEVTSLMPGSGEE